jgi:hypothetical protein
MNNPASFACKTCGHLHSSAYAGEAAFPTKCSICGGGATFAADGTKSHQAANWEVLSSATPERLKELGLAAGDVAAHVRKPVAQGYREDCDATLKTIAALDAKEAAWRFSRSAAVPGWQALDAKLRALGDDEPEALAEKAALKGLMHLLEITEFTADDEHHRKCLQARIALGADKPPQRAASRAFVRVKDGAAAPSVVAAK